MRILNPDAQCKVEVMQWNQRGKEHATPEGRGQLAGEEDLQPMIARTSLPEYNNQNVNTLKQMRPRLFFQCLS